MTDLVSLQHDFQAYLLHPDRQMHGHVVATPQLGVEERLDIYADAYRLRLEEALGVDFVAVHTLVGDSEFRTLARAYIDAHPSRHYSIRWFGQHLSAFLRNEPRYANRPVLAEMASFEWALGLALDAADAPCLDADELTRIPHERWPGLRITLHPSVHRLELHWSVPQLWKAIDAGAPPQQPVRTDVGNAWLIWRRDLASYFRSVDPPEAWALRAVAARHTFAELCEGLGRWIEDDQVAIYAATLLRGWLDQGLLSHISSESVVS